MTITRQYQKDPLADKVYLARRKSVAFVVLRKGNDVLRLERRPFEEGQRNIIREQPREARCGIVRAPVLNRG